MFHQNQIMKKVASCALVAGLFAGVTMTAQASIFDHTDIIPMITAGAPPDSPGARVDPNVSTSAFSGVVSINIRYRDGTFNPDGTPKRASYICSGALVGKRSVVSAGHCIDQDGNGHNVDINAPGSDVRVIFNSESTVGSPGRAIITATKIAKNPDYAGFGKCPVGVSGFCLNDDVAVITLGSDAPSTAKIYKIGATPLTTGQHIVMAGYGTSGDGINGFTVAPDFRVKRSGENYMDLFRNDDETGFSGGPNEVWYADFDGGGKDTFCEWGIACTPSLANDKEAGIGGGDSGGPSFMVNAEGEYILIGNNTFGQGGAGAGKFGSYFGGMVLSSYRDFIDAETGGRAQFVPEPASLATLGLGLAMLLMFRRRSKV